MAKNTGRGSVAGSRGPMVGKFQEMKKHGGSFRGVRYAQLSRFRQWLWDHGIRS